MFDYEEKVMTNNAIKTKSHLSHQTMEHKIREHITLDINILIWGRYKIFGINRLLNKKIITSFFLIQS